MVMADYLRRMIEAASSRRFDADRMAYQLSDLFLSNLQAAAFQGLVRPPSAGKRFAIELAVDFFTELTRK